MKVLVRVRPGARADAVGGRWDGLRGPALLVAVRARAVDGRANAAVEAALAGAFGVRRADVGIVAGHRGRDKVVEIRGGSAGLDDPDVAARLAALLAGASGTGAPGT